MSDTNVCKICNGAVDSWKHVLIECPVVKCVWALLDEELVEHMVAIITDNARLWLVELQDSVSVEQFIMDIVALWSIWWARRKVIHEQQFHSPLSTWSFIKNYVEGLVLLPDKKQPAPQSVQVRGGQKWMPPQTGWVKVHVDASISRNGQCMWCHGSGMPRQHWPVPWGVGEDS